MAPQAGIEPVVVKGKNIDVTPALRAHAEKRLKKLEKFFDDQRFIFAEVVLRVERELQIAEVTAQVDSLYLRGEGNTEDMYVSIDAAVDKIDRQIRKYKSKIQARFREAPKISELQADAVALSPDPDEEPEAPKVVRTKRFAMKPMDIEEAIMQMELLGHDFFVFQNAQTDMVNVLYQRKGGDYGLIEPEF